MCENADSKLVDVDAGIYFDNSLVEIWTLKFGHKAEFLSDFAHKVWTRF